MKRRRLSNIFCCKVDKLSLEEIEAFILDLWEDMDSDNDMKIRYCLEHRADILNKQFSPTPQNVEQFRRVSELLIEKTEILYRNATIIFREQCAKYDAGEYGDFPSFSVKTLLVHDSFEDFFEELNGDTRSDYNKFGEILGDVYSDDFGGNLYGRELFYKESREPLEKYIEDAFSSEITDGKVNTTRACGSLYKNYPELNGIPVCFALYQLATYLPYSIEDIIRLTNFRSEVKVTYHTKCK